ncbi:MAG: glycoside hydrolase family 65 central catalytic [Pseudonocardiales bacterium]|nr:glycoside hydrolase family 65 central catalytic [Pseudonocardiales bacterium]
MAARNLQYAARAAQRWPAESAALNVSADEIDRWNASAAVIAIPYDDDAQMPEQDRGSTQHERWDFETSAEDNRYPLLLSAPYFELYRRQVVKQADLILAMHWCGDSFTIEEKAKAFAYYEELTVRDSSLSACSQSVVAAEVGQLELAHDYLREAALMDLRDLEHNTRDGVHVASLAGAWLALVCGFGGLRDYDGQLSFAPRLPKGISRLTFAIRWQGCKVRVVAAGDTVQYSLEDGPDAKVSVLHHGQQFNLATGAPVEFPIPPITPLTPRPSQPPGRAPVSGGPGR